MSKAEEIVADALMDLFPTVDCVDCDHYQDCDTCQIHECFWSLDVSSATEYAHFIIYLLKSKGVMVNE